MHVDVCLCDVVVVIFIFIMSGVAVAVAVAVAALLVNLAVHKIEQGHVGVYFRVCLLLVFDTHLQGGALLKETTQPGYHQMIPFITDVKSVQITMQTDAVTNIPCGTRFGPTHSHTQTHTHTQTYTQTDIHTDTCTHTNTQTDRQTYTCTHM